MPQLHRIYVGKFGNKSNASGICKALIDQLRKSKHFEAVDSSSKADALLSGETEIYVRGYFSLYVRAGTSPANGQPVYGGYVSVELKSHSGETIWSYLSTLPSPSRNPGTDMAKDVIKHLVADEGSLDWNTR